MRPAVLLAMALLLVGCSSSSTAPSQQPTATPRPDPTLPSDALSQMEIAFVGSPRQAMIKEKLEAALALYDLEPSEANYRMAGDALVAVRQNAVKEGCEACTEMAILDKIIAEGRHPGTTFPEAVVLASVALTLGL